MLLFFSFWEPNGNKHIGLRVEDAGWMLTDQKLNKFRVNSQSVVHKKDLIADNSENTPVGAGTFWFDMILALEQRNENRTGMVQL